MSRPGGTPTSPPRAARRSLRCAIVGAPDGWHASRLAAAAEARGHAVLRLGWEALGSRVDANGEAFDPPGLAAADVVCVRGMPGVAAGERRLEQVVFRMDVLGRLAAGGIPVINPPRALEAAIDKYLATSWLAAAGLPVPRTAVVQSPQAAAAAWRSLGGDCVVKPLFGSQGKGLVRLPDSATLEAWLATASAKDDVSYLQEFRPHDGWDVRILMVGERCFSMRRVAAPGEWRTNLAVGGRAEAWDPPAEWMETARRAAVALGTTIAGVDLLPAPDGSPVVLEVNAVPGWRGLEAAIGADVTGAVLDHLEATVVAR